MDKRIVHHVFEQTAAQFPDRIAVEQADRRIGYARLNLETDALAGYLRSSRIAPQTPVGIFMPSGLEYLIAILGIAKAGCIFMPLAVDFPQHRLITILKNTQPRMIFTDNDHAELLEQLCDDGSFSDTMTCTISFKNDEPLRISPLNPCSGVSNDPQSISSQPNIHSASDASDCQPGPDDGLYVMHTSGSTGVPKAILGCHKGLSHFIHWEIREFGIGPDVRVSLLAPPTFDVSLRDMFVPLMAGGTVCIPDPEIRNHASRLVNWLEQAHITLMHCTPSVFRLIMTELDMRRPTASLPALEQVLLAGEPLYGEDVNRWQEIMGNRVALVNLYGPTETTLAKLFHCIVFQPYDRERIMPLGQPISNTGVLILKDGRLCPIGEKGDIYIKTPFRTKGYYRDPDLTAQRFIQNPLNPGVDDIIYHTGDQGRYRSDRSVEFLGREDDQIKRHGIRVEPAEIEQALRSHDTVTEAIITTRHSQADRRDIQILAYFTGRRPISSSELRDHIHRLLPDYMVPDFFIQLDAFPRNAHGKTDRNALPLPSVMSCESLPETGTEVKLAAIWQEILGIPAVGKTDSFFDVGGNSLNAMRIAARIYHEMHREIPLKAFFEHPKLQELAALIESRPAILYQPIPRAAEAPDHPDIMPLSAAQHRLWVLHQMEGGESVYNIPIAYTCRGPFDMARWKHALYVMVERHDAFRTSFVLRENRPWQRILPTVPFDCELVDLSGYPDPQGACRERVQSLAAIPFDLSRAPLMRATVFRIGTDHHVLALVVHHIVSDAWSMDILARETAILYANGADSTKLPPLPCRYPDYTLWQKHMLDSPELKAQGEYWHRQLAGELPVMDLPTDFIRPAVQTYSGNVVNFTFDESTTEKLTDIGRHHQASAFMVMQTLIKILLHRYSGQEDIRIGSPVAGRIHPDVSGIIGCFVNMLVLRDRVDPQRNASELLEQVRQTTTEALTHQEYPFDRLVNELVHNRDISRNPLTDVVLAFYEADPVTASSGELVLTPFAFDWPFCKMDLIFTFRPVGNILQGEIWFRTDLFRPDTIRRMITHLNVIIHQVRGNPVAPIADLTILPDAERSLILDVFAIGGHPESGIENGETIDWIPDTNFCCPPAPNRRFPVSITEQISRFAMQIPNRPAVICEEHTVSYGELNRRTDELARHLRHRGMTVGMPVAVLLSRSPSWIIAMIGIMKAGGVYLPVDPLYPESRIRFMLEDSGCRLLITSHECWEISAAFDTIERIDIDDRPDDGFRKPSYSDSLPEIQPEHTAYMIYTSGSTGVPKGVMIPHRGPVNMAGYHVCRFGIRETDRLLQFSSPGFDASIYEIYMAFLAGASLVIATPARIQDPERFIQYLTAQRVSLAMLPPVYLSTLNRRLPDCVEILITGGEAAVPSDAIYYGSRIQFINAYGPTEISVCAACHRVRPTDDYPLGIPIGKPITSMAIHILDSRLEPVPIGIPGEICISGIGLAHGYHNRPEQTAQAFIPHPFSPGNRLYRSGDIGKWLPDGNIVYLGRKDDQVKIRGHRIEIQEVVQVLRNQPEIRDAVVFSRSAPAGLELIAYCIPETLLDSPAAAESAIKQALNRLLPVFMVPSRIVFLEFFPLTANGKIDRRALPDPHQEPIASDVQVPVEGMAGLLAQIWCQVLGTETVGLHDDFFALGGDSIKAIQVAARLHENHLRLPVADIYRFPTLAELIGQVQAADPVPSSEPAWGQVPPTPIQCWFFDHFADTSHHFNQAVLLEPVQPLDPAVLNKAFRSLLDHHDTLRSRFLRQADRWVQTIDPPGMKAEIAVMDWSGRADADILFQNHQARMQASFELNRPPLVRVVLYRLPGRERLLIVCHHLVVDTVSWRILLKDLESACRSGLRGETAVLPAKTIGVKQWAEALQAAASCPDMLDELSYWKRQVSNVENFHRPRPTTYRDLRTANFSLTDTETSSLLNAGQHALGASVQELLIASLVYAFSNWQGQNRLSLAMEHHGRESDITAAAPLRTVGWFTSLFPVTFTAESDIGDQIRAVQRQLEEVPDHGIGFGVLKYFGSPENRISLETENWPSVSFNYLGQLEPPVTQGLFREASEPIGPLVAPDAIRVHDLDIQAWIYRNAVHVSIYFHPDQMSEERIQHLIDLYRQALLDMVSPDAERSAATSSENSRFYGLSDLDLEIALGDC